MLWNSNKLTYFLLVLDTDSQPEQWRTSVTAFVWTETPESPFPVLRLPWNIHGDTISLLRNVTTGTQTYILIN